MNVTDFDGRTLVVSKAGNDALAVTQFAGDVDGSRKYSAHCHFLTVQAAIDFAQAGDNVNIHAGDYTGEIDCVLKDRVSLTCDANVILGYIKCIDVKSEIHGNPEVIGERCLDVFGVSDLEIELGVLTAEKTAIRIGNAPTDIVSISGYTGDIIAGSNGVFITEGNLNVDLTHDDIFVDTVALRFGGIAPDALNEISLDWEARDCIGKSSIITNNGNSKSDARIRVRDIIANEMSSVSEAANKAVWLNSAKDEIGDHKTRITLEARDIIGNMLDPADFASTVRVNSGINNDINGHHSFIEADRIIYNGADSGIAVGDDGAALVFSKGGGANAVSKTSLTIDVNEILGRAGAAIRYVEAISDVDRTGLLRIINCNITNDNTDIQPIRVNTVGGSLAYISLEGCAIYTPDNVHIIALTPADVRIAHKTQTLVNKPDINGINPVTDWDGNGGNANQIDSLRTNNGSALVSETPYTRIPDAELLALVNL